LGACAGVRGAAVAMHLAGRTPARRRRAAPSHGKAMPMLAPARPLLSSCLLAAHLRICSASPACRSRSLRSSPGSPCSKRSPGG
jgi:hypothetical protein